MFSKKKDAVSGPAVSVEFHNAINTLAANIDFSAIDKQIVTLAVVSSVPSEGKSTIAAALARSYALRGEKTLIIECDMRHRSLDKLLKAHGEHGVRSVLQGECKLDDAVVSVPYTDDNLYFLDAEVQIPNPTDLLQSAKFKGLIAAAKDKYTKVIIDTPPVLAFADASVVASVADATILVARRDYVRTSDIKQSMEQLKQSGAHVIGTVLDFSIPMSSGSYYYHDYYRKYYHHIEEAEAQEQKPDTSGQKEESENANSSESNETEEQEQEQGQQEHKDGSDS